MYQARIVFFLLLFSHVSVAKDPAPIQEDRQHVLNWNGFFNQLVKTHQWYRKNHSIREVSKNGGYANKPNYYREVSYYDSQTNRLLSRIRWIKKQPDLIHMIELFVYDEQGKLNRDYLAAYLPEHRNAPIQTLVNLHSYNDQLHAYRQFDASGEQIYEQCKGSYFNEEVLLSIEDHEFADYRNERADGYETYIACFEMLPKEVGAYLKPYQAELRQLAKIETGTNMVLDEYENLDKHINKITNELIKEPNRVELYVTRGDAWFKLHEFQKAVADYDQALSIDNNAGQAWFGRGMAYGRMGQIDRGISDLSEFIKRNPESSLAYTKRGVRYLWKGDRVNAEKDLRMAIKLNPKNAEAHDDLGVIHAQRGELEQAVKHFSKTVSIDPTYQKGHHNLAMAYHLSGQHSKALQTIDRALALKSNEKVSLLLKSQILEAQGKHQQALLIKDEAEYLPDGNWSELAPSH